VYTLYSTGSWFTHSAQFKNYILMCFIQQEVVKNEIQVMNQLNHANLIQLYASYESRNDIILVLE